MSTNQRKKSNYYKSQKPLRELKPLHHTWPFWTIILLSVLLPTLSATLIYPTSYWNLTVLENGSELFKTPIVIGGACLSLLTIYSLAYRSLETNRQHYLSRMQFIAASRQTNIQLKIKLMEQSNLAIATIMRLQDRLNQFNSLIDLAINTFDTDLKKYTKIHSAIKVNIIESYRIYTEMLDKSPELLSSVPQPTQQYIDGVVYGSYQAVMIWPEDPIDITTKELKSAKIDFEALNEFEKKARDISESSSKLLKDLVEDTTY